MFTSGSNKPRWRQPKSKHEASSHKSASFKLPCSYIVQYSYFSEWIIVFYSINAAPQLSLWTHWRLLPNMLWCWFPVLIKNNVSPCVLVWCQNGSNNAVKPEGSLCLKPGSYQQRPFADINWICVPVRLATAALALTLQQAFEGWQYTVHGSESFILYVYSVGWPACNTSRHNRAH